MLGCSLREGGGGGGRGGGGGGGGGGWQGECMHAKRPTNPSSIMDITLKS